MAPAYEREVADYSAEYPGDAWVDVRVAAEGLLDAVKRVKRSTVYKNLTKESNGKEADTLPGRSDECER